MLDETLRLAMEFRVSKANGVLLETERCTHVDDVLDWTIDESVIRRGQVVSAGDLQRDGEPIIFVQWQEPGLSRITSGRRRGSSRRGNWHELTMRDKAFNSFLDWFSVQGVGHQFKKGYERIPSQRVLALNLISRVLSVGMDRWTIRSMSRRTISRRSVRRIRAPRGSDRRSHQNRSSR
jgi:hypothetical protein